MSGRELLDTTTYVNTSGCCVSIATQQPDYGTGIYQMLGTAYRVAPDDGQI